MKPIVVLNEETGVLELHAADGVVIELDAVEAHELGESIHAAFRKANEWDEKEFGNLS